MVKKYTTLLASITLFATFSCSGVTEVSAHKNPGECSLWIFWRTDKLNVVGQAGFFFWDQSLYIIDLPDLNGKTTFDKLKVRKDGSYIDLKGGSVEFLEDNQVLIALNFEFEGKAVDLEINGIHKISK